MYFITILTISCKSSWQLLGRGLICLYFNHQTIQIAFNTKANVCILTCLLKRQHTQNENYQDSFFFKKKQLKCDSSLYNKNNLLCWPLSIYSWNQSSINVKYYIYTMVIALFEHWTSVRKSLNIYNTVNHCTNQWNSSIYMDRMVCIYHCTTMVFGWKISC